MLKHRFQNRSEKTPWQTLLSARWLCSTLLAVLICPVYAATLTVGPGGMFGSLQAALDSSVMMAGDDEIRVRTGTYMENILIDLGGSGDRVEISGGWNATFTVSTDGRDSILDGNATGPVMEVQLSGSDQLVMHGFVVRNGLAERRAGISLESRNSSSAELYNNTISNNRAEADRPSSAGLYSLLLDTSQITIRNNSIIDNTVIATDTVDARGGGLTAELSGNSMLGITGNIIADNQVTIGGAGSGLGAGLDITNFDPDPVILMTDNVITGNRITASSAIGTGMLLGGAGWTLRRNQFIGNIDDDVTTFGAQLSASVFQGEGVLSDTLIAMGNARGLQLNSNNGGLLQATNLTIVEHAERGILASVNGTGTLSVFNSISVNADTNAQLNAGVSSGNNLFVNDPGLFINAPMGNYELAAGSAAIDAGDNSPPGGLGSLDLNGAERVVGAAVDIGAYERGDILFEDGFES